MDVVMNVCLFERNEWWRKIIDWVRIWNWYWRNKGIERGMERDNKLSLNLKLIPKKKKGNEFGSRGRRICFLFWCRENEREGVLQFLPFSKFHFVNSSFFFLGRLSWFFFVCFCNLKSEYGWKKFDEFSSWCFVENF